MERSILIDTHCHLDDPAFDPDREEVLARARMAGVEILILPGVEPEGIPRALALAERHPGLYVAVGIHPHVASQFSSQLLAQLRSWARHPRVVAIGEIGLDFYRDRSPREAQREAFRAQLELAGELGLPVIIHQREAREAVMEELERWLAARPGARGVLHAFSGDPTMAGSPWNGGSSWGSGGRSPIPGRKACERPCGRSAWTAWCWRRTRPICPRNPIGAVVTSPLTCGTWRKPWPSCSGCRWSRSPDKPPRTLAGSSGFPHRRKAISRSLAAEAEIHRSWKGSTPDVK
jgi:Mg-dependent DNase